jgi:S-adenosyl-L-methionine hydrolase (adenosine-forming)
MSRSGIITLTTDFGPSSPYVACMKGVILTYNPRAVLVDVTHGIRPFDIRAGALALAEAMPWFPPGTIHVAVVDPGVGSDRRLVYARFGEQHYLAPDNGLLSRLAQASEPHMIVAVEDPTLWLEPISSTFHGRDILAPVAASLSLGLDPARLGRSQSSLVGLTWPEVVALPGKIEGAVESIDDFGNLVTNITAAQLVDCPRDERTRVACDEHETFGIFQTYSDQPSLTLVALIGSHGRLELAIVEESAAAMLGVRVGERVVVTW